MVKIDPNVVIRMMFPANSLLQSMASAIIKVAMAVGVAKRINITPKFSPQNPNRYDRNVRVAGIIIIFIKVEENASLISFLTLLKFNEAPIPSKAKGRVRTAK